MVQIPIALHQHLLVQAERWWLHDKQDNDQPLE
jgi:hypothetical protein